MTSIEKIISENTLVASLLANHFGLPSRFFSLHKERKRFNKELEVFKVDTVVLVKVPEKLKKYLKSHKAILLSSTDKEEDFDYVIEIYPEVKVGFWR